MTTLDEVLRKELATIAAAQRYRHRRIVHSTERNVVLSVDDRECLTFCSNDYLGLARHPKVREAFARAAREYGVGSGASHLVSGHHFEHHALEEELAAAVGRERALLFSTGYMANLGIASALLRRGDRVLEDRLNHASLLDAGLKSGAEFHRYQHIDMDSCARALAKDAGAPERRTLVLTDAVFSMDGDMAPLQVLAELCKDHRAWLAVDDAHGFGVVGAQGEGSVIAAGLSCDEVPVYMATLGKALGVFGAFVAGSQALIELLIQKARTYIYTTALPPAVAAAARAALELSRTEEWRRAHLHELIACFRKGAAALGLTLLPSTTPIQAVVLGSEQRALAVSELLLEAGLLVVAIRPPTVPIGTARLRITFSADHTLADVERLLDALARIPAQAAMA